MSASTSTAPAGAFEPCGRVAGTLVATDPAERFVAVRSSARRCAVYDVRDFAAPAYAFPWTVGVAFVDPAARAVVARGAQGRIVRRGPGRARCESSVVLGPRAWLRAVADGAYIIVGDLADDGAARLTLLDGATLATLDVVSDLRDAYGGERLATWGEDLLLDSAPAPCAALAVLSNVGDDVWLAGVCEARDNKLAIAGLREPGDRLLAGMPGERVLGACLEAAALFVVDSDHHVVRLAWREAEREARVIASGYSLLQSKKANAPELATLLARRDGEYQLLLNGPMARVGNHLLVTVEQEVVRNHRWV